MSHIMSIYIFGNTILSHISFFINIYFKPILLETCHDNNSLYILISVLFVYFQKASVFSWTLRLTASSPNKKTFTFNNKEHNQDFTSYFGPKKLARMLIIVTDVEGDLPTAGECLKTIYLDFTLDECSVF